MRPNYKLIGYTIGAIIAAEALSWFGHANALIGTIGFVAIVGIITILSVRRLEYGVLAVLAELAIGSQGRLLTLGGLSLRMALFAVVLLSWVLHRIKTKQYRLAPAALWPFGLLAVFILVGIGQGIARNQLDAAFFDLNAWLFFGLLVVFIDAAKNTGFFTGAITVLGTATAWLCVKTIATLILFSHAIALIGGSYYVWLRDSRIGEITYVSGNIFRVFFQSHIYVLIGAVVVFAVLVVRGKKLSSLARGTAILYLYCATLTIIISQSRSFWLGGLGAIIGLLIVGIWKSNIKLKTAGVAVILLAGMLISQMYVMQFLTGSFGTNVVGERFKGLAAEAAGVSRLNQLEPLAFAIGQRLLFGYGFGKTLTYVSTDPRIVSTHPDGVYTTYAFEWGYLDIMLKLGALGLLAYLIIIGQLYRLGWQNKTITAGCLTALTAVLITNIFSPYLNHPLGIGFILLLWAYVATDQKLQTP